MPPRPTDGRAIFFEFIQIGNSVKATAIDEATGVEVSVIGPVSAARSDLERLAISKLKRALDKRAHSKS